MILIHLQFSIKVLKNWHLPWELKRRTLAAIWNICFTSIVDGVNCETLPQTMPLCFIFWNRARQVSLMEMGKDIKSSYSLSLPQDTLTHWTKCYVLASSNVENMLWTRKRNILPLLPRINLPGYNTNKKGGMSKDILTSRCFIRGEIESKEGNIKFLRTIQWGCSFSCTTVFQKHQYSMYLPVYFRETLYAIALKYVTDA